MFGVHGAEDFADNEIGVAAVACADLGDGVGKQALLVEDAGVFCEKAEYQPRHKVVHAVAFFGCAPLGVGVEQLYIQAVEPRGGADIEGAVADLFDGGNARQREKKAEMVGKIGIGAGNVFACGEVFGFDLAAVGGEHKLGFGAGGGGAGFERLQGGGGAAFCGGEDVDIFGLQYAATVGFIGFAAFEAFDGGGFVAEGFEKLVGKFGGCKRLCEKFGDGLFDFYGVHGGRGLCKKNGLEL